MERLWELPIGSARPQDVFAEQLLPQWEMSGVLSLPVVRLVRVAEPSLRICKFCLINVCVLLCGWVNLWSESLKTSLKGFLFCQSTVLHTA